MDILLEKFDNDSNFIKKLENERQKVLVEKKGLKSNKWKNVDLKLNSTYDITYTGKESLKVADTIKRGNLSAVMDYKGFYIKSNYRYKLDRYEIIDNKVYQYPNYYVLDEFSLGYKKTLNDFLYSEEEYKENSINFKEKITNYKNQGKIIEKKEELIDKYVEIKNDELEGLLKKKQLEEMEEIFNILKAKLVINESTNIDFNILRLEINKTREELGYILKNIKLKKNILFEMVGIKEEILSLEELSIPKSIYSIENNPYLKALEEEFNLEKEGLKYIKRQNQWPLEAYVQYETISENYQVGLNFNLDLFKYRVEEKQKKKDIETKLIDIEDEKINRENIIKERTEKLEYFQENVKILEELSLVYLEKYNYIKGLYQVGDMGLLDYLKAQTESYKADVSYLKMKNNYYALQYKNYINGGNK